MDQTLATILAAVWALLTTIGMSVGYSLWMWRQSVPAEPFSRKKFYRTVVTAVIIGALMWVMRMEFSESAFISMLGLVTTFGGGLVVIWIDQLLAWMMKQPEE